MFEKEKFTDTPLRIFFRAAIYGKFWLAWWFRPPTHVFTMDRNCYQVTFASYTRDTREIKADCIKAWLFSTKSLSSILLFFFPVNTCGYSFLMIKKQKKLPTFKPWSKCFYLAVFAWRYIDFVGRPAIKYFWFVNN